jgi:molybdopterin-guanine dinucleotide biosynthesis protein A
MMIIINSMISVVIQAGGESRRMGTDKGLVTFLEAPLVQRIYSRVVELADELIVTSNNPQAYAFLNLPVVSDRLPGRGALGGLYTALSAASHPLVAVVACDMPFVNAGILAQARDMLAADHSLAAVIPRSDDGAEPFHAVYRRDACLPAVEQALNADRWRVDAWFSQVQLHFLTGDTLLALDPDRLAFWNVNTPQELLQAEHLAASLE